ncbi:MAG TPA: hypothetical protein VGA99_03215 [bacterium]
MNAKNLTLVLALLVPVAAARAQYRQQTDFGSIVTVNYMKSGDDPSPLWVNNGRGTFNANWSLFLAVDINEKLAFYAEATTWTSLDFVNYGLSGVYRIAGDGKLNLEFGRFLAPFGNFLNRRWASENPLNSWPLQYDYHTALASTAMPVNAAELLAARGRGLVVAYDSERTGSGYRIFDRNAYPTGAQLFGQIEKLGYHFGVANGALSNQSQLNNSGSVQLLGRLTIEPAWGLLLGASFASGVFLDQAALVSDSAPWSAKADDYRQTALGVDLGYSVGHLEFFGEVMSNRWQTPFIADDLATLSAQLELKYTLFTRFYVAGRFSLIRFSDIDDSLDFDSDGELREAWDFDVDQLELGAGYRFNRNGFFKLIYTRNRTREIPAGDPSDDVLTAQTVISF